jgi:hypothetical protein
MTACGGIAETRSNQTSVSGTGADAPGARVSSTDDPADVGFSIRNGDAVASTYQNVVNIVVNGSLCSGIMVAEGLVVTAAHCVESQPTPASITVASNGSTFPVQGYQVHPDYVPTVNGSTSTPFFDVAVLEVQGTPPAGYQKPKLLTSLLYNYGTVGTAVGYGLSSDSPGNGRCSSQRHALFRRDRLLQPDP